MKFVVPGNPVSWMVQTKKLGRFIRPVTHDRTISWQARVAEIALAAGVRRIEGGVYLRMRFCFEWPASSWRKTKPRPLAVHTQKPDLTNLVKAVEDALTGIAYRDDAQVCETVVSKVKLRQGEPARVEIEVGAVDSAIEAWFSMEVRA
jgi:Holliday junction resolvase RusA-like endonuclease